MNARLSDTHLSRSIQTKDHASTSSPDLKGSSDLLPHRLPDQDPLWSSLCHFIVGGIQENDPAGSRGPALSFAMRLARENRWNIEFANRCIEEYKRFLYLAARAPHRVTPSDAVDQVWHQHLVYTENYWNDLCTNILPSPLHHGPTRGGKAERARHVDQYELTLETYQQYFGDPPIDIWPVAVERFRQSVAAVRVDSGKHWIVPNPMQWLRPLAVHRHDSHGQRMATPALLLALASMPLAIRFPFNLNGSEFLVFYAFLSVAVFVIMAIGYRLIYSGSNPATLDEVEEVGWGNAAILSGGKSRLLQTSIGTLVHRGQLTCTDKGFGAIGSRSIVPVAGDDDTARRTMNAILDAASHDERPRRLEHLRLHGMTEATRAESQLQSSGLMKTPSQNFSYQMLQFMLLIGLFAIGGLRVAQGVSNGRPVLLLVMEILAVAFAASYALSLNNPLTPAGTKRKKQLHQLAMKERAKSVNDGKLVGDSTVPLVLAVLGAAVASECLFDATSLFAVDELYGDEMRRLQARGMSSSSSSDGGWFDSGGSDSGGGGDAGCGGGCGGCGGD